VTTSEEGFVEIVLRRLVNLAVYSPYVLSIVIITSIASADMLTAGSRQNGKNVAVIVESLKKELKITSSIEIKIVKNNRLGLSVEPIASRRRAGFLLQIDSSFLNGLDDDELRAALAHELGHVWIYTHHPYLQTEALANQIAMRAVTRSSFKKLYAKVWNFEGSSGNTEELLGSEQATTVKAESKH
jgi:hypothetical protein